MFIPLEIKGDIVSATTDQKVWGSNPYGRAASELQALIGHSN